MNKKKTEDRLFFGTWPPSDLGWILLIIATGFTLILYSLWIEFHDEKVKSLILHIGVSLVVSGILILTAESFSRSRQEKWQKAYLNQVNEDVFRAVFKKSVTETLLTEVIDTIVKPPFIRRDFKVRYFLKPLHDADCGDILSGEVEVEYTIENTTDGPQKYTIRSSVDRRILPDKGRNLKFGTLQIIRQGHPGKAEPIVKKDDSDRIYFEKEIRLEPSEKKIIIKYGKTIWFFLRYNDIWVNKDPSENLVLTISESKEILEKGAIMLNPHPERLILNVDNSVTKEWEIKGPLLPYQGINFWWYPRV